MPPVDVPVCACHDQPKRWNRDPRYADGGFWRCVAGDRARTSSGYYQERWHRPNGGYIQRRRIHLAAARTQILERLEQLQQEAVTHVEP